MKIGTVEVPSQLVLAPMAGVTDLAFRLICRELGAGLTVTEMVSAKALCYQDKKSRGLLKLSPGEHPASAQIFGSDPVCMAEAACIAAEISGADLIDINMGCPVGKIVSNGDGSASLKWTLAPSSFLDLTDKANITSCVVLSSSIMAVFRRSLVSSVCLSNSGKNSSMVLDMCFTSVPGLYFPPGISFRTM